MTNEAGGGHLVPEYALARLPATAITAAAGIIAELSEPNSALFVEAGAVTLLLRREAWPDFAARLPGAVVAAMDYRPLGCGELSGAILARLASAGIGALAYSGAAGICVFVSAADYELAQALVDEHEPD